MLRIAICDDNRKDLSNVGEMVRSILEEQKTDYKLTFFLSPDEMLNQTDGIDIGILDIVMEEKNGLDLGQKLKERFPDIRLIYVSSYEQYVLQAINDVHAYSYLCKPIEKEKLRRQILELLDIFNVEIHKKEFYKVNDSKNKAYEIISLNLNHRRVHSPMLAS